MTPRICRCLLIFMLIWLLRAEDALGQAAWEYTPYQGRVWLAMAATPQLPVAYFEELSYSIPRRSSATCGAILELQAAKPPEAIGSALLRDLEELTPETIAAAASSKELEVDKLYLTSIAWRDGQFSAHVRELDCRSRQLGPVVERTCLTLTDLPLAVCDAVVESFTPLARIVQVEDTKLVARLRAGGLINDLAGVGRPVPGTAALAEPGAVLRPIIRRNDRTGQPVKGGIQAIPWSYLTVVERHDAVLDCALRSGYRSAIPTRSGARIERLALMVRPRHHATRLLLRSRSDPAKPLVSYEIHRRMEGDEKPKLLGETDDHGAFPVPRGSGGLETLIVKSGNQLLARLPLVPGYEETLTANVIDDDGRLAAEGFVTALSSRVVDLVARREILASQIRARVKDGKSDEAQRLLDDFRRLQTRADLTRDLDRYRQLVSSGDTTTRQRIDRVFADAQKLLLLRPLNDELLVQLTREVTAAKSGG